MLSTSAWDMEEKHPCSWRTNDIYQELEQNDEKRVNRRYIRLNVWCTTSCLYCALERAANCYTRVSRCEENFATERHINTQLWSTSTKYFVFPYINFSSDREHLPPCIPSVWMQRLKFAWSTSCPSRDSSFICLQHLKSRKIWRQKTPLKSASVSAWTSENSVWIRRNCYLKLFLRNTQKSLSGFRSAHVEFALPEWIFTFQLKEDIKIDSALWTKLLMHCVLVVPSRTNEGHRKIIHKKRATTHSSLRLVHVERYCCEQLCLFQL